LELSWTNFFDPYYGEGDTSSPSNEEKIASKTVVLSPSHWIRLDRALSFGITASAKYREEDGVDGNPSARIFGTEFTPIFGLGLVYDDRDNQIDTHRGWYFRLSLDVAPSPLSVRTGAETFGRAEAELRYFQPVGKSLVVAGQLESGVSAGPVTFPYQFSLGGGDRMRGYETNRLLGDQYYLAQLETRLLLLSWLSVVGFSGVGDVAAERFSDFHGAKLTAGAGLRVGLPPSFVAKARLDFGIAPDESHFYVNFNEAF
jgi:outer membrane protein assembly factor BamA